MNTEEITASFLEKDLLKFSKLLTVICIFIKTDSQSKDLLDIALSNNSQLTKFYSSVELEVQETVEQLLKDKDYTNDSLYKLFRQSLRVLKSDKEVSYQFLDLLKAATSYLISNSDTAFNSLVKSVPVLDDNSFNKEISKISTLVSQKTFVKPLQKIVQAVSKRTDVILSREESIKLKEKFPKLHIEYLRLRKGFNESWKIALRNFVLGSKKLTVSYSVALEFLRSQGISHTLPIGFTGKIDAFGRFYTTEDKLLANVPGVGFSVKMNLEYDPKSDNSYVFTTINDADGTRSQHVYTVDYKKKTTSLKFKKVQDLTKIIEPVRKKWLASVKKSDTSPACVASTLLELVYDFSARIGSLNNEAAGQTTYGLSTLQAKHFKKQGSRYLVKYLGKDAVPQVHILEPISTISKLLIKNLDILLEGKTKTDRVFIYEYAGKEKPMTAKLVNLWFKKLGSEVTVHKLRHVKGTELFKQLLLENESKIFNKKPPLTEAQYNLVFKKLATKVGAMLGHVRGVGKQQKVTPSTAIANYIDPGIMIDYFNRANCRMPKYLQKFV